MTRQEATPTREGIWSLLADRGYAVVRGAVEPTVVAAALRRLNVEILRQGLASDEIARCMESTFFPHLRWEPEILGLRAPVERFVVPEEGDEWADSQLLLRFPDEADDWPLTPHLDQLPHWADGRDYRAIVGVPLTRSHAEDGCVAVWPRSHVGEQHEPERVELDAGDILVMHPRLEHSSTLNRSATIRYAVYFRLLGAG